MFVDAIGAGWGAGAVVAVGLVVDVIAEAVDPSTAGVLDVATPIGGVDVLGPADMGGMLAGVDPVGGAVVGGVVDGDMAVGEIAVGEKAVGAADVCGMAAGGTADVGAADVGAAEVGAVCDAIPGAAWPGPLWFSNTSCLGLPSALVIAWSKRLARLCTIPIQLPAT
ncbi:MAG: Uncharacterised protein [Prochlorococcus marinus str. MIT 9215]|nr:MAG: Uncharacterised protein [Prochlorococcus marinus str. MIT 9215]